MVTSDQHVVGNPYVDRRRALRRSCGLDRLGAHPREADLPDFQIAFAHTLRRVDPLQPALLVVSLISTIGFALSEGGATRLFAVLAGAGF
jgi:hypothetical protein